jgi:methyl-accepting chemotaxis protein WspA
MLRIAYEEGETEILTAILSCALSYEYIAKNIVKSTPASVDDPFYGDWVKGYTSELYCKENIALTDMLEKAAEASALEIQKTLKLNRQSENAIDMLLRKYETLALASNNVAKRLAMINENAEKITGLITTISDVSLRTNLLSLNASIEAEKVGEMGLGFAVVSHQIRTLAEKTSKVSTDIEKTVTQMQSSINASIMEMDKFSANMRINSNLTIETAKKLSASISNIETIEPKFENISRRIADLAETAIQITNAIQNITKQTSKTKTDVEDIAHTNSSLKIKTTNIKNALK